MIYYNDQQKSKERSSAKPLTLKQNEKVISILNERLFNNGYKPILSKANQKLIQRFVNNYQNFEYHRTITIGLYATDKKELAKHKDFFRIK